MAAIATTVFAKEAKNSANILRMPDFITVEITHPLSTLTQEQIRGRAYEAVQSIVQIITGRDADLKGQTSEIDETRANRNTSITSTEIQEIDSCTDD